jgi:hypothetical protein
MKKKQPQCGGGCLGAPLRALSRACDSACDLYVRGMSGCAGHVPSGAAGAVGRGAYGVPAPVEVAAPGSNKVVPERKAGAAAMETIAEDAPCEFGAVNGACVLPPPSRRRRAAAAGLAARPGGFGAIKVGSEALTH